MKWYITGPTHGDLKKIQSFKNSNLIILGDSEFFSGNDPKLLKKASKIETNFYCVRGGYDNIPDNVPGVIAVYDEIVQGVIYINPKYPNIKFFEDGEIYTINGKKVLVLGGGKPLDEDKMILSKKRWFPETLIPTGKREEIAEKMVGKKVDIVLSYTAPRGWKYPGKSYVQEQWLGELILKFDWDKWYFSRYEEDKNLSPNVVELYEHFEEIK